MTNFEKTTLTQKGINLLAKQGNEIEFLGIETGNGTYSMDEDVTGLSNIKQKVQEFGITSVVKKSDSKLAVKFVLSNADLTEDYRLTEIGIYANDPVEGKILYALCYSTQQNADMMRKYNGIFAFKTTMVLNVVIHAGMNVIIHPEGMYALAEDLEKFEISMEQKLKNLQVLELEKILTTGDTLLIFENQGINTESTIDIYTSIYGVNPKTVSVSDGSISMIFKAQTEDLQVKVVIK